MNCTECENDSLLKYADLQIEYDKLKRYYDLTVQCLDVKDELCKALRDENQELIRKVEIYKDYRNRTTEETCPHCDTTVELPAHLGIYECPECGKLIVACSMCDDGRVTCFKCKFAKLTDKQLEIE